MTTVIVSVIIGLIIVLAAVGIPYWMTHRRMHPHHDLSGAQEYLEATGKSPEDAAEGRPGDPAEGQLADGHLPRVP
jgi:hypothetical protein